MTLTFHLCLILQYSQKIDRAYAQQPAFDNGMGYAQPMQPMQPQYGAPAYVQQPVYGEGVTYAQPIQPQQQAVQQPAPFEPDDPIPETTPQSDKQADKKHRPRFVDYFLKRKNKDE